MMKLLTNLASATSLAAARTSQEAVVFASLGSSDLPEVYHLEEDDADDSEGATVYVDDMDEAEYLMGVIGDNN